MSDQMLKYLQAFLPFLNGIHESLFEKGRTLLEETEERVFIIYIHKKIIDINSNLKSKKQSKIKKKLDEFMPNFPKEIEEKMTNGLKEIKSKYEKKQKTNKFALATKMRDLFIQIFVELLYDYMNYLTLIDESPIFNANALLKNRAEKDFVFYREFIDTQIFQLFLQTMVKDDHHQLYFNSRVKQFLSIRHLKNSQQRNRCDSPQDSKDINKATTTYSIKPFFIPFDRDISFLEIKNLLKQKYPKNSAQLNENGILKETFRTTYHLNKIPQNEKISTYKYYKIPNKKYNLKEEDEEENQQIKEISTTLNFNFNNNNERKSIRRAIHIEGRNWEYLLENEKEEIKDGIKVILTSALRAEKFSVEEKSKQLMSYVKFPYGRNYFIKSICQNKIPRKTIILISPQAFDLFNKVIYGVLLEIIAEEETESSLENAVALIRATECYYKDEMKNNIFIFEEIANRLNNYSLLFKNNFWSKWLNTILIEEYNFNKKDRNDDEKKQMIKKALNEIIVLMKKLKMKKENIVSIVTKIAKDSINDEEYNIVKINEMTKCIWEYEIL